MTLNTQSEAVSMSDRTSWIFLALALCSCPTARAEDKGEYPLLHPTPRAQMREFESDRPGTTESLINVAAGRLHAEFSCAEFTHDRTDGVTTDTLVVLPANPKV